MRNTVNLLVWYYYIISYDEIYLVNQKQKNSFPYFFCLESLIYYCGCGVGAHVIHFLSDLFESAPVELEILLDDTMTLGAPRRLRLGQFGLLHKCHKIRTSIYYFILEPCSFFFFYFLIFNLYINLYSFRVGQAADLKPEW